MAGEFSHWFAGGGAMVGAFLAKLVMHPMDKRAHKYSHEGIGVLKAKVNWLRSTVRKLANAVHMVLDEEPEHKEIGSPPPYEFSLEEITKPGAPIPFPRKKKDD